MVNLNLFVNTKNGSKTYCFRLNIWLLLLIRWVGFMFITRITIKTRSKYKKCISKIRWTHNSLHSRQTGSLRRRYMAGTWRVSYFLPRFLNAPTIAAPALFIENIPPSTKRAAVACVETCQVMFYFVYGTI